MIPRVLFIPLGTSLAISLVLALVFAALASFGRR